MVLLIIVVVVCVALTLIAFSGNSSNSNNVDSKNTTTSNIDDTGWHDPNYVAFMETEFTTPVTIPPNPPKESGWHPADNIQDAMLEYVTLIEEAIRFTNIAGKELSASLISQFNGYPCGITLYPVNTTPGTLDTNYYVKVQGYGGNDIPTAFKKAHLLSEHLGWEIDDTSEMIVRKKGSVRINRYSCSYFEAMVYNKILERRPGYDTTFRMGSLHIGLKIR